MKSLCLVALSLTVCWPVATPDVSGGAACTGHLGELNCTALNGQESCLDQGNVFTGGYSDNNTMEVDADVGATKTYFCKVLGGSDNCSGSAQKPKVGCAGVVKPVPLPGEEMAMPL